MSNHTGSHPASAPRVSKARADIIENGDDATIDTFDFILNAWTEDTTKVQIQEILVDADGFTPLDAYHALAEIRRIVNA